MPCTEDKAPDDRFIFTARNYRNLPHWHGVLVNDEHLFLGRTDWKCPNGNPELAVGQNKYRYYNTAEERGEDRVKLFLNWHKYYTEFASTLICSIPSQRYATIKSDNDINTP